MTDLVPSGHPSLDAHLGGGIPNRSRVLLAGGEHGLTEQLAIDMARGSGLCLAPGPLDDWALEASGAKELPYQASESDPALYLGASERLLSGLPTRPKAGYHLLVVDQDAVPPAIWNSAWQRADVCFRVREAAVSGDLRYVLDILRVRGRLGLVGSRAIEQGPEGLRLEIARRVT